MIDYVGYTGDMVTHDVWSNNYVAVYHMDTEEDSESLNSASSASHGKVFGTVNTSTDLALGKTTDQISDWSGSFTSNKAVDGNPSTWAGTASTTTGQWWKVDLGAYYSVSQVRINKYGTNRPNYYNLQTADDWAFTNNVTTIVSASNENSSTITYNVLVNARYFRIITTSNVYLRMYEFNVYGATSIPTVTGKVAEAYDFDGSGDTLRCGSASSLDDISNLTVEAIINPSGWGESSAGRIYCKADVDNTNGHQLLLNSPTGQNVLYFMAKWSGPTNVSYWETANGTISLSQDQYVAVTYDTTSSGNDPIMYINSSIQSITESPDRIPSGTIESDASADLYIGSRAGSDRQFDGVIDEFRMSNVIRSSAWLKASYYSAWDSLITTSSGGVPPVFDFTGYVQVEGQPAARVVNLYRRSTGELVNSTVSASGTGVFSVSSPYEDYHYTVILPELNDGYDLIAHDKIHPTE
jgi:hypothetical protein